MSFGGETSGKVAKFRLFSQAITYCNTSLLKYCLVKKTRTLISDVNILLNLNGNKLFSYTDVDIKYKIDILECLFFFL